MTWVWWVCSVLPMATQQALQARLQTLLATRTDLLESIEACRCELQDGGPDNAQENMEYTVSLDWATKELASVNAESGKLYKELREQEGKANMSRLVSSVVHHRLAGIRVNGNAVQGTLMAYPRGELLEVTLYTSDGGSFTARNVSPWASVRTAMLMTISSRPDTLAA